MNVITSLEDMYVVVHEQIQGARPQQEDHIHLFESQCIALADGVGAMPNGEIASAFVCETAIWGYKHVRQRPYYWENKIKLLQRIFRTTNLALWQKRKESAFREGLASTLCLAILGAVKIWIGIVGDSRVYLIREGLVEELVNPESQREEHIPMALGFVRTGIIPRYVSETLVSGDVILLCTDGVSDVITEEDIRMLFEMSGTSEESCKKSLQFIIQQAQYRGGTDNMSACLIKKI